MSKIHEAFRDIIKIAHPDKHANKSEERKQIQTVKTQKIHAAREYLEDIWKDSRTDPK